MVLLAVSGIDDVMTVFRSDDAGNVVLHVRSYFLAGVSPRLTNSRLAVIVL
jgi:hypothetical protein